MESLWECRKEFFKVFITDIQDDEVKNRIKIWYYQQHDQQANPNIFTIVKVARQFKKEKDEDNKITRNESKSIEQKNEILLEYCNKMESLWESRKEFFKVFITGIQDDEVKNRIKIWYYQQHDQQVNPDIFTIVKVARQFKQD